MQLFYVYILKCNDGSYYIGHTDNLEKRIQEHNMNKYAGYTATRLPVELVFSEEFTSRDAALNAEHKLKKWTRKKRETLIKHGWQGMQSFAKKHR